MIMLATFWENEEECWMEWLGMEDPACITNKFFHVQVSEILIKRVQGSLTGISQKVAISSSKPAPAEQPRPSLKGVVINEPVSRTKATELSVPEGKGKVPMENTRQSPASSSSSSLQQEPLFTYFPSPLLIK